MAQVSRARVYAVLDGERDYQNNGEGNAAPHPDSNGPHHAPGELSPGEGLLCMEEILAHARAAWYKPDGQTAMMPFVRKIGAVAVQLMENYGAPPREGHEPDFNRLHDRGIIDPNKP